MRSLPTSEKVVLLTFDAGADAGYTQLILQVLARNGITGAFGITGQWAERYPSLVREIAQQGHALINHSWDHSSFTGLSTGAAPLGRQQRWEQLDRTETLLRNLTGASTLPYFRPPYGDYDASVNHDVGMRGYSFNLMWAVDSYGWRGISAREIVDRCVRLATPGAILIFHVGSASEDGPALQGVIDGLRSQGYSFASIREYL
jgi:peptidoglycan-N-acetylglucosamine deacetylase